LAQFPRAGNPTYRSSSPNPSTTSIEPRSRGRLTPDPERGSEPDPAAQRKDHGRWDKNHDRRQDALESTTPTNNRDLVTTGNSSSRSRRDHHSQQSTPSRSKRQDRNIIKDTPHNEYPLDGMTMYCRPGMMSDSSLNNSPVQTPSSSHGSDYSTPTIGSESGGSDVQAQAMAAPTVREDEKQTKRKSGFFSGGGPFRRKSKSEKGGRQQFQQQQRSALQEQRRTEPQRQTGVSAQSLKSRNTWSPANTPGNLNTPNSQGTGGYGSSGGRQRQSQLVLGDERHASPEPIDPTASVALNIGGNVFDVSTPRESQSRQGEAPQEDPSMDPIAHALAELKGVTNNPISRNSADRFFGIATPAPSATPALNTNAAAGHRGTPPPTYLHKSSALDVPPPAFDSAQMQQTTQRYVNQRSTLLEGPSQMPAAASEASVSGRPRAKTIDYQRPHSRQSSRDMMRDGRGTASPVPNRSVSPRPQIFGDDAYRNNSPKPQNSYSRSTSPNPYTQSRPGTAGSNRPGHYAAYNRGSPAPSQEVALSKYRTASPAPSHHSRNDSYGSRSRSRAGDGYGSANNRQSYHSNDHGGAVQMYQGGSGQTPRPRSKSTVDCNRSRDGRPIINYARAMYQYYAAIPEEMSFAKGDILAVLAHQEDGWWEAELVGAQGRPGLVPSNYLQVC
jgi:hypothetical protein